MSGQDSHILELERLLETHAFNSSTRRQRSENISKTKKTNINKTTVIGRGGFRNHISHKSGAVAGAARDTAIALTGQRKKDNQHVRVAVTNCSSVLGICFFFVFDGNLDGDTCGHFVKSEKKCEHVVPGHLEELNGTVAKL